MNELIRKLKEKKFITKVKVKDDLTDELLYKEIPQTGSIKIVEEVKKEIGPVKPPYAVMRETNAPLMNIMYKSGLAANENFMTYEEAANVHADDLNTGEGFATSIFYKYLEDTNNLTSFDEFQYFTGVEEIKPYTFTYGDDLNLPLTSIIIPDSVTSIGASAFYNSDLTSIIIPNSVSSIGKRAFEYCSSLSSLEISGVTSIGERCFFSCTSLINISWSDALEIVGDDAFYATPFFDNFIENHPTGAVYMGKLCMCIKVIPLKILILLLKMVL